MRIYVPFLRSPEVFGQLGKDETWKFLIHAKIELIINEWVKILTRLQKIRFIIKKLALDVPSTVL